MKKSEILRAKYEAIVRERVRHSDQPLEEFCRQHGIKPWTFYYWKKVLRKSPKSSYAQGNFIPLRVASPLPPVQDAPVLSYEIRFSNGGSVHISGRLDLTDLTGIIRSVAGVPS